MSGVEEVTTLNTPAGMSVSSATIRARAVAQPGVSGAGFRITVHPAPSAGTTFARLICHGKFQGVIAATTPAASRSTQRREGMPMGSAVPRSRRHS